MMKKDWWKKIGRYIWKKLVVFSTLVLVHKFLVYMLACTSIQAFLSTAKSGVYWKLIRLIGITSDIYSKI